MDFDWGVLIFIVPFLMIVGGTVWVKKHPVKEEQTTDSDD